jgi:hypothetical protein
MTEDTNPGRPEVKDQPKEDLLYHYTSLPAFQSIVENGKLWATQVHYLNDTSEQRLFEQLIRSRIEARLKTASSSFPL